MSDKKTLIAYIISILIVFIYAYVFFQNLIISIMISFLISIKAHLIVYSYLDRTNIKLKRIMFREFLDIFNSNIISGYNFYKSLINTSNEIKNIFHEEEYIVKYLDELILDIDNGKLMEDALNDFKYKGDLEELSIFIDSLILSIKSGIDISKITNVSKDMITENISLEIELSMISDNSKKEFIIMSILPLIILIILNFTQNTDLNYIDYIIRTPIFILFIFSFYLGNKIVNLEV